MNKIELQNMLEQAGIDPQSYWLDGGLPNERYVLSQEPNGQWSVYYSERGQKTDFRLSTQKTARADSF